MNLDSKYFDSIRSPRRKRKAAGGRTGAKAKPQAPVCQWDGCEKRGEHRAPVGREAGGRYFHFCTAHVREYNKGYNYFSGLSEREIARYQKELATGHRPTWTVGVNRLAAGHAPGDAPPRRSGSAASHARMRDLGARAGTAPRKRKLKALEARALDTLGLAVSATTDDIKARYKELVKRHHPDANGGDRGSEDRFRAVIQAYRLLKRGGFC